MRNQPRCIVDVLESRMLMSGTPSAVPHGPFVPPLPANATATDKANYAAVESDLTTIQTDQAALQTAVTALQTAYKNALTTTAVETAQTALQTAQATAKPLIQADLSNIQAVYVKDGPAVAAAQHQLWVDMRSGAVSSVIATDQANLKAAETTLSTDLSTAQAQLATDEAPVQAAEKALQAAINADPGVTAAQATLTTDQTSLAAAQKQFQTDLQTYVSDLKAGI